MFYALGWCFAASTATLAGVALQAWRQGNERCDVALLGAVSGGVRRGQRRHRHPLTIWRPTMTVRLIRRPA